MENFELKKMQVGNEIIAYREGGRGEKTLVLVHGNMSSSFFFGDLMIALEETYKIFALDLRGFGHSSYESGFDSLKALSEDLELFVETLRLKEIELLGWSTGGGIIMQFAADNPELVKRLILLDSVGISGYPLFKKDTNGQPILTSLLKEKDEIAKDPIQVAPVLEALEKGDRNFYKALWDMAIFNVGNQPDSVTYEMMLDEMLLQRNLVDIDYALTRFNLSNTHNGYVEGSGDIEKIKCPVSIIQGADDLVVPLSMAEGIASALGDRGKLHVLERCGHNPMVDQLSKVLEIVREG